MRSRSREIAFHLLAGGLALPALLCVTAVCSATVTIYTKDSAPVTPKLEDLLLGSYRGFLPRVVTVVTPSFASQLP